MQSQTPPHFPRTPDLSKIVTIILQNIGNIPVDIVPSNVTKGLYMIAPTSIMNMGPGMWVSFLKTVHVCE